MAEFDELVAPIYNALRYYDNLGAARFHMPGHSGVNIDDWLFKAATNDITEMSFSDKLISPHGIIEQSEELMAAISGAMKVLYLTSGGTGAIFIAMATVKNFGNTIITDRNAHKSVYAAARTLGMRVIQANASEMLEVCDREPGVTAALVTTPNYYGKVTDFDELREELGRRGIIFMIDHCHGAHFVFSSRLPRSCFPLADMVISSLHKTLPIMTGGAMLSVNREDLIEYALYNRMTLHTTSAPYPILGSMDFARAYMQIYGEGLYDKLYDRISTVNDELSDTIYSVVENDDWSRLVIHCGGMSGFAVKAELEREGVFPEMANNAHVVFITTPFNCNRIDDIVAALHKIDVTIPMGDDVPVIKHQRARATGVVEFVRLEDSIGRVAVSEIGLYPPGTPIIISGDVIDQQTIDLLNANRNYIIGLVKGLVPVLK